MKNSVKNINERYTDILNLLQIKGQLTSQQLSEELNVSISTIRRDLMVLEKKNDIIRKHGFCLYNFKNEEFFDETGPELLKNAIAREASHFINKYDTVFINSSSTAIAALDYVKATHLTVVSNNLKLSQYSQDNHSSYILTGGEIRFPKEALVGDIAGSTILSMNADTCIIGCSGVDVDNGVTTKILNEAKINELMVNQTVKNRILVADHRKIGQTSKFKIADLSLFNYLITDQYSPKSELKKFEKLGIEVMQIKI